MWTPSRRGLAAAGTLLVALSCQSKLFTITIDDGDEVVVPQGTLLETLLADFGFGGFVSMNLVDSEELRNQGVEPGDIRDARMVALELEAIAPAGADLSFLDQMQIYVEAPGLPKELLASAAAFPEGQALVAFTVEDLDLTDYVVSENLTLTTDVTGRRPDVDTTVAARFSLDIGVTGQGACNEIKGDGGDGT